MMQISWNAKNLFKVILVVGFGCLAYLIFFSDNDPLPEIDVELRDIISYAVLAAEMGGHAVAKIHQENALNIAEKGMTDVGKVELLTKADLVSNFLILDVLKRFLGLKIVTEEKESEMINADEAERYKDDRYSVWMSIREDIDRLPSRRLRLADIQVYVDPLDATQEFTENLTDYVTVMVCITQGNDPIFGAIYRPFQNETIFGLSGWGAMKASGQMIPPPLQGQTAKTIVVSRSHAGKVRELAARAFGKEYTVEPAGGSGYKTLRVVNGTADLYMHTTAVKKWDTCAGDAVLRALGGAMLDFEGNKIRYGPEEDILHKKGIIAAAAPYSHYRLLKNFLPDA